MRLESNNLFRELEARMKPVASSPIEESPTPSPTAGTGTQSFINSLSEALREVNRGQLQNMTDLDSSVRGQGPELHKVMAETEEAGLAFQMTMQFRNKALEAYQDVMRMQF
ncbi:flagellar hook-basal body complex protein FliE [bacterium]|nr:flagellar hook-basal body complex protein FliE [bacterium]